MSEIHWYKTSLLLWVIHLRGQGGQGDEGRVGHLKILQQFPRPGQDDLHILSPWIRKMSNFCVWKSYLTRFRPFYSTKPWVEGTLRWFIQPKRNPSGLSLRLSETLLVTSLVILPFGGFCACPRFDGWGLTKGGAHYSHRRRRRDQPSNIHHCRAPAPHPVPPRRFTKQTTDILPAFHCTLSAGFKFWENCVELRGCLRSDIL